MLDNENPIAKVTDTDRHTHIHRQTQTETLQGSAVQTLYCYPDSQTTTIRKREMDTGKGL